MEEFLISHFDMPSIDVCAYVCLTATGIMTLNLAVGLLSRCATTRCLIGPAGGFH